jgi:hypothetical protein
LNVPLPGIAGLGGLPKQLRAPARGFPIGLPGGEDVQLFAGWPTYHIVALALLVLSISVVLLMMKSNTVGPLALASAVCGGVAVGAVFVLFICAGR